MNTQAGYSSYLWAAVLIPPAARPPRHTRDIGPLVATQGPSPRLTAASWHGTLIHNGSRETMYCTSTARGQKLCYRSKRSGDGGKVRGREGVSSTAVTTPAWPGEESAPLTSPRRSLAPRVTSPRSLLYVSEEWDSGDLELSW